MFYLIMILAGIFLLILSCGIFANHARFFRNSDTVPGTVTEWVDKRRMLYGSQHQPRIRFATDTGVYQFDAPVCAQVHDLQPGCEVTVSLSPEFPGVAVLKHHRHKSHPLLIVPASVLIGIGLFKWAAIVEAVSDYPFVSLSLLAAVACLGLGLSRPLQNVFNLHYDLHDNIRKVS